MKSIIGTIYRFVFAVLVSILLTFPVHSQDDTASNRITYNNSQMLTEIARLGQGIVSQTLWSKDGRVLAVSTSIGIYLFDAEKPFVIADRATPRLLAGEGRIAFSPDNKYVISGSSQQQAILWNVFSGREIAKIPVKNQIRGFAFSEDSTLVSIISSGCEVSCILPIWQVGEAPHQLLAIQTDTGFIMQSVFSPDGKLLAAVDTNGTVHLWSLLTGNVVATFDSDIPATRDARLIFNHDGSRLLMQITDSYANSVPHNQFYLWNVIPDKERTSYARLLFIDAQTVTVSPVLNVGRTIAALHTGYDFITLVDLQSGKEIGRVRSSDSPAEIVFSPDNSHLIARDEKENYWIWEVKQALDYGIDRVNLPEKIVSNSAEIDSIVPHVVFPPELESSSVKLVGHQEPVSGVYFSHNGLQVISHSADSTTRVWNLSQFKQTTVLETSSFQQESGFGGINTFLPKANLLANASLDSDIQVWDVVNGELRFSLKGHEGRINTLAFSPNGEFLASGSEPFGYYGEEHADASLRLWNIKTQQARILEQGEFNVQAIAFSPDGRQLVSGGNAANRSNLIFWDVNTAHQIIAVGDYESVSSVTFSPDGAYLAVGSELPQVDLWAGNGKETKPVQTFPTKDDATPRQIVFSPDGTLIICGTRNYLYLWNTSTGELLARYTLPDSIISLAVSPNDDYLGLGLRDGTVRVWGVKA